MAKKDTSFKEKGNKEFPSLYEKLYRKIISIDAIQYSSTIANAYIIWKIFQNVNR